MNEGSVICRSCLPEGENSIKITKADLKILARIQQTRHTSIARLGFTSNQRLNFTDFLLQYIQFHTGQKLVLNGLKLSGFTHQDLRT
jgi:hypothetical protein